MCAIGIQSTGRARYALRRDQGLFKVHDLALFSRSQACCRFGMADDGAVGLVQKVTGFELFSKDIYYLDHFPSQVIPSDVILISITAVLISFAATLYPSWAASRLSPAEALRYE